MIAHHFLFQLGHFAGIRLVDAEKLNVASVIIATVFLLVSGVCFQLSWQRHHSYVRVVKRFLIIGSLAATITVITYAFDSRTFVFFGILHLIAVSALLLPAFADAGKWNMVAGLLWIHIGLIDNGESDVLWLQMMGMTSRVRPTLDYYPLLPWFGVLLIGMGIGSLWYVPCRTKFLHVAGRIRWPRPLVWMGKNALVIYFAHLPITLGIVTILRITF